jgi:hypothetical protein
VVLNGESQQDELPVLEKQELVDRLLRAIDDGRLLEDDDESGDALARFSRRFTHNLPGIAERWPQIGRLKPLCALRAAGLILRNQLQQMNESVASQRAAMRDSAESHLQSMKEDQASGWRAAMGEIHVHVLRDLGFINLDPGMCWGDGQARNFEMCCSVGDYAARCFPEGEASVGGSPSGERQRCCGPAIRREGFDMQLIAAVAAQLGGASPRKPRPDHLVPAVSAWLRDPTGFAEDGMTWSGKVIDLLADKIEQETVMKNTEDQLQHPINTLDAELRGLATSQRDAGKMFRPAGSRPDTWLPVPTVAATGGRRTLYTTVAFTPQLRPLQDADADAEERRFTGPIEAIPLEELGGSLGQSAAPRNHDFDPQYKALHKAISVLRSLDQRADAPKMSEQVIGTTDDSEKGDCSVDGWRELDKGKAAALLGFGDRLRIRLRMAEDVVGEEGTVKNILSVSEAPGLSTMVWEVDTGETHSRYVDFSDHTIVVSVPCEAPMKVLGATGQHHESSNSTDNVAMGVSQWPGCIERNMASPSVSGFGLFLNLGAFGISEGCFLEDCSHSDHFACKSPAECARICSRIGACQLWTFREASPATCWLRSNASYLDDSPGALSASVKCMPPADDAALLERQNKPTLFKLVSGPAGTPPPNFWEEWDIIEVLRNFGHMTHDEIRNSRSSSLQRSALRLVARATSECGSTLQGCSRS